MKNNMQEIWEWMTRIIEYHKLIELKFDSKKIFILRINLWIKTQYSPYIYSCICTAISE